MERTVLRTRWATEQWAPSAVVPVDETDAAPVPGDRVAPEECRLLDDEGGVARWLHPGFRVALFTDEAEGYWLNLTAPTPFAFVNWELEDGRGVPRSVTVSYNEAARQMDGGARVDGVPMPPAWLPWIAAFTDRHYRPEAARKRARPPSFRGARRDE